MFNNNILTKMFLFIVIPTYLLAGGYGIFTFKYIFPVFIFLTIIFYFFIIFKKKKIRIDFFIEKKIWFFLILTIYSGLTLILTSNNFNSYYEFGQIFAGFMMIFYIYYYINFKNFNSLRKVLKFIVILLSIHAIFNYFYFKDIRLISVTYSNRNALTTFFVFLSPLFFIDLLKNKVKFINIISLLLIFFITYLSHSRFNLLSLFIQILIFSFYYLKNIKSIRQKKILILIIAFSFLLSFPFVFENIAKDFRGGLIEQYNDKTSSLYERIYFIREGLNYFFKSNFLGVGAGNSIVSRLTSGKNLSNLHFFVIDLLAKYGIIPLVFFASLYKNFIFDYFYIRNIEHIKFKYYHIELLMFLITFIISSNSISTVLTFRPFYFFFAYHIISIDIVIKNYRGQSL
jgi:hypothetical protein